MDSGLVGSLACVGGKHLVNGNTLVVEGIAAVADPLISPRHPLLEVPLFVEQALTTGRVVESLLRGGYRLLR